jgi:hypothetical protein
MQAEEYLNHYRGCIRIYTGAAQTLERRLADSNVGTSAKNGADSAEPRMTNEKEMEVADTEEAETESEDSEAESESEDGETDTETEDSEGVDAGTDVKRKAKEINSDVER